MEERNHVAPGSPPVVRESQALHGSQVPPQALPRVFSRNVICGISATLDSWRQPSSQGALVQGVL